MSSLISALFIVLFGWVIAGPLMIPAGWRMARDGGRSSWLALLLLVPCVGFLAFIFVLQRRFDGRGDPLCCGVPAR